MQGVPGHRSSLSAAHDHHLRMLDMAAYVNQGQTTDTGHILDQYSNRFNAAAALYSSPQFNSIVGVVGSKLNDHHHQAGFLNSMIKSEALEGGTTGEQSAVTNVTSASGEVSGYSSSGERETANMGIDNGGLDQQNEGLGLNGNGLTVKVKGKRKLPGMPDPDAEVVALSPRTLLATNRFVCEICNKGFQRDQNLQLHRRGHNLPWKLKQRGNKEVRKKVYVCPEASCVHHDPARALGDLTGIKKHFSRKHGEKKWKCDKCSKRYAVQSDWKAHSKTCGTREYRCDCGTLFSRRDSFITHRAFCDALAEESALRVQTQLNGGHPLGPAHDHVLPASLSSAVAAQLAQAGGAAAFGNLISGSVSSGLSSKLGSTLFDHISPYDNAPVASSSSAAGRAGHSRLPSWLSVAAAAGDHHQLLSANSNFAGNPNNTPLYTSFLNSLQNSSTVNGLFFNSSTFPSTNSSVLTQAGNSGVPCLFGNPMLEIDLLGDASANGGFSGLTSLHGLASFSNTVSNSLLYGAQQVSGVPTSCQQISATSLLQKAAQMGCVNDADNPSLFTKGGLGSSMAPVSSTDALYWPSSAAMRNSQGLGSIDMNHSISRGQLTPTMSGFLGDKINVTMNSDSRFRGSMHLNNMESVSAIQEMVASFNNGGASSATGTSSASLFMGAGSIVDNSINHNSKGSTPMLNTIMQSQQELLHLNEPVVPSNSAGHSALNGISSKVMSRLEDGGAAADNFTRDFLGVRGDNGMLESLDKSLSHTRDIGIDCFNNKYTISKGSLSSEVENISGQSYGKPWDANQL